MRAVGRLGQGAGVLAHGVARDSELAGDLPQGEALDPGVLHRFPERQLPRGQLPACRHGGSALYRPIGLDIFTHIITRSTNKMPLDEAVELAARLPRELHVAPYNGLLWNQSNQTIISRNKVLVRKILCYMIGTNGPSYTEQVLLQRYRQETGDVKVELPSQLI